MSNFPKKSLAADNRLRDIVAGSVLLGTGTCGQAKGNTFSFHDDGPKIGILQAYTRGCPTHTASFSGRPFDERILVQRAAAELIEADPTLKVLVEKALEGLPAFIGSGFTATAEAFVDPYDGSKMLVIAIKANSSRRELSKAIDRFCQDHWYDIVGDAPSRVLFQAGD